MGAISTGSAEDAPHDKGRASLGRPVEDIPAPITLQSGQLEPWSPDLDSPEVYVRGLCRRYNHAWTVTLFLVNVQTNPKTRKDKAWLFQPELVVTASDDSDIFMKRPLPTRRFECG